MKDLNNENFFAAFWSFLIAFIFYLVFSSPLTFFFYSLALLSIFLLEKIKSKALLLFSTFLSFLFSLYIIDYNSKINSENLANLSLNSLLAAVLDAFLNSSYSDARFIIFDKNFIFAIFFFLLPTFLLLFRERFLKGDKNV